MNEEKFRYKVGETYKTQAGDLVTVLGRTGSVGYECLLCSDDKHRYDRSTHNTDAGRVTGSAHNYSCPDNFWRSEEATDRLAREFEERRKAWQAQLVREKVERWQTAAAENAAALRDSMLDSQVQRLYDSRVDHDGVTGMWTFIGQVGIAAEKAMGSAWKDEQRDYIEDMQALSLYMVEWAVSQKNIPETQEEADQLVKEYMTSK